MRDIKEFHPKARQLIKDIPDGEILGFVKHNWNLRNKLVFTVYLKNNKSVAIYSMYGEFSLAKR